MQKTNLYSKLSLIVLIFQLKNRFAGNMKVFTCIGSMLCMITISAQQTGMKENSVLNNQPATKEDSLLLQLKASIRAHTQLPVLPVLKKDTLLIGKKIKSVTTSVSGQIDAGYEYGLLAAFINPTSDAPLQVASTKGTVGLSLVKLPVQVTFNYSTLQNPIGVNNYFRISLDREKIKQLQGLQQENASKSLEQSLHQIRATKGNLQSNLGIGEVLLQKYQNTVKQQQAELSSIEVQRANELKNAQKSLKNKNDSLLNDYSLKDTTLASQTARMDSTYIQLKEKQERLMAQRDTVLRYYLQLQKIIETYSTLEKKLLTEKEKLSAYTTSNQSSLEKEENNKTQGLLNGIKTLEFGLAYPKLSSLSNNSIPIKGLNLEWQNKRWYMAFCSGITQNNLMVSTDALQNKLTNTQQLFNQFDFQNLKEKGWINHLKVGIGSLEKNHFLVSVRYLTNSTALQQPMQQIIPSLAAEIDGRWIPKISPSTKLDLVLGKSSDRNNLSDSLHYSVVQSLLSSSQTGMAMLAISHAFPKFRTDVQSSFRIIQPNADVRSVGILQPDQMRFETKTTTRFQKGLRLGLNFRHDENNTSRRMDTTMQLNVYGVQINGTMKGKVSYFVGVNYLIQSLNWNQQRTEQTNYMLNTGFSFNYSVFSYKNSMSFAYNDCLLTDTMSTSLFRAITIQNATKFISSVNKFSLGFFQVNDPILTASTAIVIGDEFSIEKNKIKTTIGLKAVNSKNYKNDIGGKLEISYSYSKNIVFTIKAEKMILGDFYNNYSRTRFERFPFAFAARINYLLN